MTEYHIIIEKKATYYDGFSPKKIADIVLDESDYKIIKNLIFSSDLTKKEKVEEVKPREWWTVVDSKGGIQGDGTKWSEEFAKAVADDENKSPIYDLKPYKAIKVIEAVECDKK